jgi:response regulator of citrate/malate metabolism
MANIDLTMLDAALKDGAFNARPNHHQVLYYRPSVITAWGIIHALKQRTEGMDSEQVAEVLDLHLVTVKTYLRWLLKRRIVEVQNDRYHFKKED